MHPLLLDRALIGSGTDGCTPRDGWPSVIAGVVQRARSAPSYGVPAMVAKGQEV